MKKTLNSQFRNKTVLITGGSRGIGKALAKDFAAAGSRVAINFLSRKKEAEETLGEIRQFSPNCLLIQRDVSDFRQVQEMVDTVSQKFGRIDILVNNAGITHDRTLQKLDPAAWTRVLQTNLTGSFHCCQAVLPFMKKNNFGRIINISSIIGLTGNIGQTAYASSKAGILGLTRALALEVSSYDITVNSVAPGFVATGMVLSLSRNIQKGILKKIPKGRFAHPREVSRVVLFLAEPESSYITGQCFNVNGGLYLG